MKNMNELRSKEKQLDIAGIVIVFTPGCLKIGEEELICILSS